MQSGFVGVENKNKREISYMCIVGNDTRDDNVCTYSFIEDGNEWQSSEYFEIFVLYFETGKTDLRQRLACSDQVMWQKYTVQKSQMCKIRKGHFSIIVNLRPLFQGICRIHSGPS